MNYSWVSKKQHHFSLLFFTIKFNFFFPFRCAFFYWSVMENLELFNVLVNPAHSDFALCWHRDDIKGTASEEEERAALSVRHYGVRLAAKKKKIFKKETFIRVRKKRSSGIGERVSCDEA